MLIKTLAHEIHENALNHGWYDNNRKLPEIVALIQSEYSEALEEARAERPLVWYGCNHYTQAEPVICDAAACPNADGVHVSTDDCYFRGKKPEGIAVELIDGVIRILDFCGHVDAEFTDTDTGFPSEMESLYNGRSGFAPDDIPGDVPTLVAYLHAITSQAILQNMYDTEEVVYHLTCAMSFALTWIHKQGIDPLKLILEKHKYNKDRPYKHGKAF